MLVVKVLRFGNGRRQIALVLHRSTELRDTVAESSDPQRRRTHVDSSPVSSEVERHTDDVNWVSHEPRSTCQFQRRQARLKIRVPQAIPTGPDTVLKSAT